MMDGDISLPKIPEPFLLKDLQVGAIDPRGREVEDIFWALEEFKIYKTRRGISPFFSDDPELRAEQRAAYLSLNSGIAQFNHLINLMRPPRFLFTDIEIPVTPASASRIDHFERELSRCIAQALLGNPDAAKVELETLHNHLASEISDYGRVMHLAINVILVAIAVAGALLFAKSDYVSGFGFDKNQVGLVVMMGSIGALFSTVVRLQSMSVDPTIGTGMHLIYAAQRVIVGALGALILYFALKAGLINALFQPVAGETAVTSLIDIHWLSFVSVLAGFSERLVPNLLNDKAQAARPDDPPAE